MSQTETQKTLHPGESALEKLSGVEKQPTALEFEHKIKITDLSPEIIEHFGGDFKKIAIAIGEVYGNLLLDPEWWKSVETILADKDSDTPVHPPLKGEEYIQKVFLTWHAKRFGPSVAKHRIGILEIDRDEAHGYYLQKTRAVPRPKIPGATYGYDAYYLTYFDEEKQEIVVKLKGVLNAGPLNSVLKTERFKKFATRIMEPNFRDFQKLFTTGNIFAKLDKLAKISRKLVSFDSLEG